MTSPGLTSCAARRAMARLALAATRWRNSKAPSSERWATSAPPRMRRSMERRSRFSRSLRMVTVGDAEAAAQRADLDAAVLVEVEQDRLLAVELAERRHQPSSSRHRGGPSVRERKRRRNK